MNSVTRHGEYEELQDERGAAAWPELIETARAYRIATEYHDWQGRRVEVSAGTLTSGLGPVRVLRADLVVVTMAEDGWDDTREAIEAVAPHVPSVAVSLRPRPAEPVGERSVAYFTTAPPQRAQLLADGLGADVAAVVPALGDRAALAEALRRPDVRRAEVFLVEVKAAAVDVVCEEAMARGVPVIFCDNVPEPLPGSPDLDSVLLELASEAMVAHA